ncbi:hypothetical protein Q5752_006285 [Cryptotrichosporon argae]
MALLARAGSEGIGIRLQTRAGRPRHRIPAMAPVGVQRDPARGASDWGAPTPVAAKQRFAHLVHAGGGMHHEADAVARCAREGLVQASFDHIRTNCSTLLMSQEGKADK